MKPVGKVNLDCRISIKSLVLLKELLGGNPRRYTTKELAEESGIAPRTARELMFILDRRPDLLDQVFADKISLYQAHKITKAEPGSWKEIERTRL